MNTYEFKQILKKSTDQELKDFKKGYQKGIDAYRLLNKPHIVEYYQDCLFSTDCEIENRKVKK